MNLCRKVEKAMQLLGKRWTGLVVKQVFDGPQLFSEIKASFPISGKLLTEHLEEV